MKIPKSIKIGGHRIRVQSVKSSEMKDAGSYDDWFQLIRINADDASEDGQAEVFLHEIIEAINKKYELELTHPQIVGVSQNLFAVMRNDRLDFAWSEK